MRHQSLTTGVMHFVGVGGIGMSGIAEVLHNRGYRVRGSDIAENPNVRRLMNLGLQISVGQGAENVVGAAIVVISTAIQPDNPELLAAQALGIPVVHRAEMLGELMRSKWSIACAGTHGKTTTTSLVAALLDGAGFDPTVINGGIINAYGTNARVGSGDWMVVEADESDGSFNRLPATIAIVTNIDPEHLDFHGTFEALQAAFGAFVSNIPLYGFAAMCVDHPVVAALIPKITGRRLITYGLSRDADIRGCDIEATEFGSRFSVIAFDRQSGVETILRDLVLPMHGNHNVSNALAAIAVALEMKINGDLIREILARFEGVRRRFTKTGIAHGITVIDDYGHHPVEIAAVLEAARAACPNGRIIAVMQPHRYSRLSDLFDAFSGCFGMADAVIVADVYGAGEAPIVGIDRDALVSGLRARGHPSVHALADHVELAARVADIARPGDFVVCLGAGDITAWAQALPDELDHILGGPTPAGLTGQPGNQNNPPAAAPRRRPPSQEASR